MYILYNYLFVCNNINHCFLWIIQLNMDLVKNTKQKSVHFLQIGHFSKNQKCPKVTNLNKVFQSCNFICKFSYLSEPHWNMVTTLYFRICNFLKKRSWTKSWKPVLDIFYLNMHDRQFYKGIFYIACRTTCIGHFCSDK